MKRTHVVRAMGLFCFLWSNASTETTPKIIGPEHIQLKAHLGKPFVLKCEAKPNCENDMTLIYWLVDGSFPEMASSASRVVEMKASTTSGGKVLQRDLEVRNVTSEDFKSTFVCVVNNPVGIAKKHITLRRDFF